MTSRCEVVVGVVAGARGQRQILHRAHASMHGFLGAFLLLLFRPAASGVVSIGSLNFLVRVRVHAPRQRQVHSSTDKIISLFLMSYVLLSRYGF
jgi:hypothetical protein